MMIEWEKVEYINNIERKLQAGEMLNENEMRCTIAALRKAMDCLQEPYFEVVYHDELDRQERRIMEAVLECINEGKDYDIHTAEFKLKFPKMIPHNTI